MTHSNVLKNCSGKWKGLILPLFLSFLPILAGYWEGNKLQETTEKFAMKRLLQASDLGASKLRTMTSLAFWPEELAGRILRKLKTPVIKSTNTSLDFGKTVSRALRTHGLKGIPDPKIWAVRITANSPVEVELWYHLNKSGEE